MKNILITGIGGDIAQSVAKIIRLQYPQHKLVGTDIHSQHAGQLYVDKFIELPMANDINYPGSFGALLESELIDIAIPLTESELAVINPVMNKYKKTDWITTGRHVLKVGLDKLETAEALKAMGLSVPWTIASNSESPKEYPCILKSRLGSGSRSIFIVENEADAIYLSKRNPESIYQELLKPDNKEVTCAVYRNAEGEVSTLQMLRKLVGGFTGWAIVINDNKICQMCEKIANGLDLQGSMNVQLRITVDGPRVFEINPRFSSTALMRHELGFTDVVWALEEAEGAHIEFPIIEPGKIIVRTQGAAILN